MSTQEANDRLELQGTPGLIPPTLSLGSPHGQGFARAIQQTSRRARVSLPQLGTSVTSRKARFYSLTSAGRKQRVRETTK